MPRRIARSPRTKSELLDKMLSFTFTGDFRTLSPTGNASVKRVRPNALAVDFPDTGHFELVVRKPRQGIVGGPLNMGDGDDGDEEDGAARRAKATGRKAPKKAKRGRPRRKG